MAVVTLRRLWLNLVDTGSSINCYTDERSLSRSMTGGAEKFAGGRIRGITEEGVMGTFPFTCKDVDQQFIDTLQSWFGELVQLRDHLGKKMFGFILGYEMLERKGSGLADISVTFEELTHEEGA